MFDLKHKDSKKREVTAFAVMTIILFAFVFKSILPVGFMPSVDKGGVTKIVICSGMGEKTITVPSDNAPEPSHQDKQQTEKICAFQLLASGKILLDAPAFTLTTPITASVQVIFTSDREFHSSPYLSFAARGPPSA